MKKYTVQFELDIVADTPEQAAVKARDILLNPDADVDADVFPFEYVEAADGWFANGDHGWQVRFRHSGVRPSEPPIEWIRWIEPEDHA